VLVWLVVSGFQNFGGVPGSGKKRRRRVGLVVQTPDQEAS